MAHGTGGNLGGASTNGVCDFSLQVQAGSVSVEIVNCAGSAELGNAAANVTLLCCLPLLSLSFTRSPWL